MAYLQTPAFEARATSEKSRGVLRWAGYEVSCAFGRAGLIAAEDKREGDGATPLGIWPMRQVFWRPDRLAEPATALAKTALTTLMGWCDDPREAAYNRLVSLPFSGGHETMWRADELYDLVVVLGYNDDPPVAGRGSAIFLHVARPDYAPTEGCVACPRDDLLALLAAAKAGDALGITA
jgi:L,D-peptidoglycan transpeptidase YkuD (ErfK/YbiS/YcfS/YnhG family)